MDEVAKANLDKPLIVRDPKKLSISLNFDPKVCLANVLCECVILDAVSNINILEHTMLICKMLIDTLAVPRLSDHIIGYHK